MTEKDLIQNIDSALFALKNDEKTMLILLQHIEKCPDCLELQKSLLRVYQSCQLEIINHIKEFDRMEKE